MGGAPSGKADRKARSSVSLLWRGEGWSEASIRVWGTLGVAPWDVTALIGLLDFFGLETHGGGALSLLCTQPIRNFRERVTASNRRQKIHQAVHMVLLHL